jgi:cytochrome c biogenesis protein CcmG/thiol:disulfide interchange protein DsbE
MSEPVRDPASGAIVPIRRWMTVVLTLGAVAVLSWLLFSGHRGQGPGRAGLAVNTTGRAGPVRIRPAPTFAMPLFEGGVFRLADHRGQVIVVNFWASWCPPCREEAPELEAAWRGVRGRGIVFVGVNVWDSEPAARAFLRDYGITYPNGSDARGRILVEFGVTGIPETHVVDPEGRLVQRWIGPITREGLANLLAGLRRSAP